LVPLHEHRAADGLPHRGRVLLLSGVRRIRAGGAFPPRVAPRRVAALRSGGLDGFRALVLVGAAALRRVRIPLTAALPRAPPPPPWWRPGRSGCGRWASSSSPP